MPAPWWLVGQIASLLQCITFAYYCGMFLIGLPIFLPRLCEFLSAARIGWAEWLASAQCGIDHLLSPTRTIWAKWSTIAQIEFVHFLCASRTVWAEWSASTYRGFNHLFSAARSGWSEWFIGSRRSFAGERFEGP